ncbi:MAG: hypothetical protein LUC43_03040 [Burkholderiales bacterium]|nr:hypothetical protein [Burkholderiales bacterium]
MARCLDLQRAKVAKQYVYPNELGIGLISLYTSHVLFWLTIAKLKINVQKELLHNFTRLTLS